MGMSNDDVLSAIQMKEKGTPISDIAAKFSVSYSVLRHALHNHKKEEGRNNKCDITYGKDDGQIIYVGDKIETVDELIEHAKVDLRIWEVYETRINNWEVAGKKREGQDDAGKWKADTIWKTPLRQISIKLRRKAPKHIQDGIKLLLDSVPHWRGKLPKPAKRLQATAAHMLELSFYDVHFGKLCWGEETGLDYNLSIAVDDYIGAAEDALEKHAKGFDIEKITIPIGHDMFQANNWKSETARGTHVDSTDDRFPKIYRAVFEAVNSVVLRCRDIAKVELIYVPGNHDPETSFYLCEQFFQVYKGDSRVSVDVSPSCRKYRLYGNSLIGYNHGEGMPLDKLPLTMAAEASEYWGKSRYRFIRVGHFHKSKEVKYLQRDTYNGVDVTVLPSLSATDSWHHHSGYVGNVRAAVASLWNRDTGAAGSFPIEARSSVDAMLRKQRAC